jgi:type IV pilus assembly protein PilY1
MKSVNIRSLVLALFFALPPLPLLADPGNQYCITPPFITAGIKPNLLLMIDNSASMFDLAYDDKGKKFCSSTTTKDCTANPAICGAGDGTCTYGTAPSSTGRHPRYCYDETYSSANVYVGYFDRLQADGTSTQYYSYDFTNKLFKPISAITTDINTNTTITCDNTGNNRYASGQLCLVVDASKAVKTFNASGNYLNWLTASKFDVEKQALTGGKYVTKVCANDQTIACSADSDCNLYGTNFGACNAVATPFLMAESRGCVGQEYIKDANSANFVNYSDTGSSSAASLGVTFTVTGPKNRNNQNTLSPGGQTYLNIFEGSSSTTYNYYACQQAVEAISTGNNAEIKQWVDACLATTAKPGYCDKTTGANLVPTWTAGSLACAGTPDCVRDATMPQASKVCSAGTNITCSTDANCVLAPGTYCSGQSSRTCTGATDTTSCKVTTPAVNGKCTASLLSYCKKGTSPCQTPVKAADIKQSGDACTSDASCSNWRGNPTDWVAQAGACTGYSPATSNDYGPCIVQAGGNFGTCVSNDLSPCVLPAGQAAAKNNVVFMQSMQECWAMRQEMAKTNQTIADAPPPKFTFSNMNTVKQMCPDVYASYKACSNNTLLQCSVNSDCPGTNTDGTAATCLQGPAAIGPGNPAYLCGQRFVGQCFVGSGTSWTLKGGSPACQDFPNQSDYASADIWRQNSLAYQEWDYCNNMTTTTPQVLDPSNAPSDTTVAGNLPAILSGISVISQLGGPLATIPVRVVPPAAPTGIVQQFGGQMRIGLMSFNQFGSNFEQTNAVIGARKVCSNDSRIVCTSNVDCGGGSTACNPPAGVNADMDGSKILHYPGQGTCSVAATQCSTAAHCPSGEKCVSVGVGDHDTGMINKLDSIRGATWTPFSEAFYNVIGYFAKDPADSTGKSSRTDLRLNSSDFATAMNPSEYVCQSNNALLVTDGTSTADQKDLVTGLVDVYKGVSGNITGTCSYYAGSQNFDDLVWLGHNRNIKTFSTSSASPDAPQRSSESVTTYVVFNGADNGDTGDCNNTTLLTKAATNGGTTLLTAAEPTLYKAQLQKAFEDVAAKAASGTAASILSNSEGSGANILQAVFYPKKIFANDTAANWVGEMQNLWYFVDPLVNNSTIREDTDGDRKLNLVSDYVVRFMFVNSADKTMVQRFNDADGDGVVTDADKVGGLIDPDDVKSIWRAGKLLWSRNLATLPRDIKTTINGTSFVDFSSSTFPGGGVADHSTALAPYLNVAAADAPKLINWVHGQDQSGLRPRTVNIKNDSGIGTSTGVWRLGDIISSTPRVQSTVRLNTYNLPPPGGYSDASYLSYITSDSYKNRGMVYVGANDGMLHAFNLGVLSVQASGNQKATLTGDNLGKEVWSFIPRNSLPYLRYAADENYGHLYYVDGRTVIIDASIGDTNTGECVKSSYWKCAKSTNTWRSIVISGMGIGGASAKTCAADTNCVQTPLADPDDATRGLGYSSYFAIDVTEPASPTLLWEFTDPALGYSTTGPAIVRLGDGSKNGRWFAVFGSGPTGPIDTDTHQFKGASDQALQYFVVDLRTGALVKNIPTGIGQAFSGTLLGAGIDADRWNPNVVGNYQDDGLYTGYVKTGGSEPNGGVGRILIDPVNAEDDPNNTFVENIWHWSKVIDDIGPVTTAISRLQDRKNRNLWLFFGTGRYYYRAGGELDDYGGRRALFGIKDPCYNKNNIGNYLDKACTDTIATDPVAQDSSISVITADDPGWKINLDPDTTAEGAERVVTDTVALTNGTVFFTSFKPTTDICGYGGNSFLWGVKYDDGGRAAANALTGKALIQLSTGEFREVDLSQAFVDKLNRRMATPMTGKPPSDAPPIISNSTNKPIKRILHIQEH